MNPEIIFTEYARFEAERRQIAEDLIKQMVLHPQQRLPGKYGRMVYQVRYHDPIEDKEMLLRVIIEEAENLRRVITAYKTSKIAKYWQQEVKP